MVCEHSTRCVTLPSRASITRTGTSTPEIMVGIEPERAQRRFQLRLRHDAGAAPRERLGDPLMDRDLPAAARERERGEQPAHRSADHQRASHLRQAHSSPWRDLL